jgi:O-antigen ligase
MKFSPRTFPIRLLETGARILFALTLVLIPFRWRVDVWFRPAFPVYADYTDFHVFAADVTALYAIVFWGCSLLLRPRKVVLGNRLIWACLLGLTAAAWISTFGSQDAILSRYHAARFTGLLFFYLYVVNEIHTPAWVIAPVAAQILIQSVAATGQSLAQTSLGLRSLGEHLLDPETPGVSVVKLEDGTRFLRAYGLTDHPNILGGCIAFGLVLLLAAALYGKGRLPALASGIFLAAFPALIMTYSRSAWLSLMAAGGFMVGCEALARRWDSVKRALVLGGMSAIVALPLIVQNHRVFQLRMDADAAAGDAVKERVFLLNAGNTLFVEHSGIGVGLGVSPLAMKNRFEYFPLNFQPPHFTVLTAALETGVIGGVFYLLLLLAPGAAFALRWRDWIHQPPLMGALALLLALSVVGLFDYYTWTYAPGRLWQWLGWGLYSAASARAG